MKRSLCTLIFILGVSLILKAQTADKYTVLGSGVGHQDASFLSADCR
ncbi:MAG TPA: hypothetical protein VII44_06760 [Puia sp.]